MKLVRYGNAGEEKPGMIDSGGTIRSLEGEVADISAAMIGSPDFARLKGIDPASLPKVDGNPRIGPAIDGVGKLMCIGLNYTDHAEETGAKAPAEPIIFNKATSSICGPDDDLLLPRGSEKTDWEVELGIVIGRHASYVSEADALDYVAGFCVVHDVSERAFQIERGGNWTKGKSCDTFGSIGPWLVSSDEVGDPQKLALWAELNGQKMQDGTTANMIFSCAHIVSYLSEFMSLHPGDVIPTGTPAGVGMGMKPPRFLRAGDVVTIGIDKLGTQTRKVVAAS